MPRWVPKASSSTAVLTPEEEAVVVAFRRHTLLLLTTVFLRLQPTIPYRPATLHRCPERHGISWLQLEGDKPSYTASHPIGYFHVDIAEVRTEEGSCALFVAIDRTSKFSFVRLVETAGKMEAACPSASWSKCLLHPHVLTDNGAPRRAQDIWDSQDIFDCPAEHGIEQWLTKVNHPGPTAKSNA